jgi:hypothetical protein
MHAGKPDPEVPEQKTQPKSHKTLRETFEGINADEFGFLLGLLNRLPGTVKTGARRKILTEACYRRW